MVSLTEQVECVKRELVQRRRVYGRRVSEGKMTAVFAAEQIAAMEAVLKTVEAAAAGERLL